MLTNIHLPGDKSLSHRALILAALRTGVTELENLSSGEDVKSTISCLQALDVSINVSDTVTVHGVGLNGFKKPEKPLDCGNSGTTMRLFMGLLAGQKFDSLLVGDSSLSKRPMKRIADPLRVMGAQVNLTNEEFAPIHIRSSDLSALNYELPIASAQVKSALLLAGLVSGQPVNLTGKTASRDHTERLIPFFLNQGGHLRWRIPSDISAASFWLTAGLLKKVKVKLEGVLLNPTRMGFVNLLRDHGARMDIMFAGEAPEPYGEITVEPSTLNSFRVPHEMVPFLIDEIPLLVLLATQCSGISKISGAEELRYKESDRIDKTADVLRQLGVHIETTKDGFIVEGPQSLVGGTVKTFDDHRLTMMAAVAGLISKTKVEIANTESARISDPYFFKSLEDVL